MPYFAFCMLTIFNWKLVKSEIPKQGPGKHASQSRIVNAGSEAQTDQIRIDTWNDIRATGYLVAVAEWTHPFAVCRSSNWGTGVAPPSRTPTATGRRQRIDLRQRALRTRSHIHAPGTHKHLDRGFCNYNNIYIQFFHRIIQIHMFLL